MLLKLIKYFERNTRFHLNFSKITPLVLLTALISCIPFLAPGCSRPAPERIIADRVIVICLDAFRFDHLTGDITPNLVEFQNESVSYVNCHSAGSWTKPSIASLFTGKWGHNTGAIERYDVLPEEAVTLAEVFGDAEWDTVGISGNIVIQIKNKFSQGFKTFIEDFNQDADVMVNTALDEIQKRMDSPFFMYIHLMDTHMPLNPPAEFRREWQQGEGRYPDVFGDIGPLIFGDLELTEGEVEQIHGLYDAEAAFADTEIGRFIDTLKEWEIWDTTTIVFFADHGEELGEHDDWTHGHCLYEEVTHVPLLIKMPGIEPSVVEDLTSLTIVGRSILDSAGIEGPVEYQAEYPCFTEGVKRNGEQKCMINDDGWKLIWRMKTDTYELYNIFDDPNELSNVFGNEPDIAASLIAEIEAIMADDQEIESETRQPTPEELEQLRAIGYAQ